MLQSGSRNYYFVKVANFDDARNDSRASFPLDILFTEEQYATAVLWAKAMCEMHRIPKALLRDPTSGREHPWIDVTDLIEEGTPREDENKERTRAFPGIIGHTNIQRNRLDPGASLDYYRIKRGISDSWWYPINRDDAERPLGYINPPNVAAYMRMLEYRDLGEIDDYFRLCEAGMGLYPLGRNRLWHGGIHLASGTSARPVYCMANGKIIAARISNGTLNTSTGTVVLPYSRCFVLVRHEVHTQDHATNAGEIDYGHGSTTTIYSLYMHLRESTVTRNDEDEFAVDYDALPVWLNHYMIDHPTDTAPENGQIFYPDQRVTLSDHLGHTGPYITRFDGARPVYEPMVHIEVFTLAEVSQYAGSPWDQAANRVEDLTADVVADLDDLDIWLQDQGQPGIDEVDVQDATPDMRQVAVRSRSEWSLDNRNQLSHQIVVGSPPERVDTTDVVPERQWEVHIRPLCFHTDMQATADAAVIGPYLNDPVVWHLHPFEFMRWMNARVDAHETAMRSQDKRRSVISRVRVEAGYVIEFVNPVPSTAPAGGYGEVTWGENLYEVRLDALCDPVDLTAGPQSTTRFHLRLLDALDLINDRPHGLDILLTYVSDQTHANSHRAVRHALGHAADLRPGSGVTAADWYGFIVAVDFALEYLGNRDGADAIASEMLLDAAPPTRVQIEATANSGEWLRRLRAAANDADPTLTANDPAFGNLTTELGQMRLHLYVP